MNPPDLQPAFAAFLCIAIGGILLGGSATVLRLINLSRHHLERLAALQELEVLLAKALAIKQEKIAKMKKNNELRINRF